LEFRIIPVHDGEIVRSSTLKGIGAIQEKLLRALLMRRCREVTHVKTVEYML